MSQPPNNLTVRELIEWYLTTYNVGDKKPGAIVRAQLINGLDKAVTMLKNVK